MSRGLPGVEGSLGIGGESPALPPASALAGSTSDPDEVSANQRGGRCRQRRLLSRPVSRGKTNRGARPAYHPYKPTHWAVTWRGKPQISQENGQWSRLKTLRNFWKCWVSTASGDLSQFIENYKEGSYLTYEMHIIVQVICMQNHPWKRRKERKSDLPAYWIKISHLPNINRRTKCFCLTGFTDYRFKRGKGQGRVS